MKLMKAVVFAFVVANCGFIEAIERSGVKGQQNITLQNQTDEEVIIKIWKNVHISVAQDKLQPPVAQVTLKPDQTETVVLPRWSYWVMLFSKEGKELTKIGGLLQQKGLLAIDFSSFTVIVEKKRGSLTLKIKKKFFGKAPLK